MSTKLRKRPFTISECQLICIASSHYKTTMITGLGIVAVINCNKGIIDSQEASLLWDKASNYVKLMYKQNLSKFLDGTILKFGNSWLVTTEGMEAIAGIKDQNIIPVLIRVLFYIHMSTTHYQISKGSS